MRLLPDIRFGTERYPEKVARRLRTLNFGTWIAAGGSLFFGGLSFADLERLGWLVPVHLAGALVFAGVPLLHRLNSLAGPAVTLVLFYLEIIVFTVLVGTDAGIQFYFLLSVGLTVLYFGTERVALIIASAVLSVALIVAAQLAVPHDTGLLPRWLVLTVLLASAVLSVASLVLIVSYALGEVARAESKLEREYERSERLLGNILPAAIAERLKRGGGLIADRHDEASVLFADMAGFTARASESAPDELVQFLNRVFSDFDRLVETHGLEKIKTTGDAYMVVSGVPVARPDHAEALAALALEMRAAAAAWRDPQGRPVPLRLGLSSGPVVAGVVGTRKFFYDVWGDAVNVAARMETTGEPGQIQVSREAYERLRQAFVLQPRGEIEVKGKGRMPTWFLLGRLPTDPEERKGEAARRAPPAA